MKPSRQKSRHGQANLAGLDLFAIADAVRVSPSPAAAWQMISAQLSAQGLTRTAVHVDLPLDTPNPFAEAAGGQQFGEVWDTSHDRRIRTYQGDIRRASSRDLRHIRPTLMYLGLSRKPMWIEHVKVIERGADTAFAPLCRVMVEHFGQHQALALPLCDPATGRISMLSVWGDEPRRDLPDFLAANLGALHMAGLYFYGMFSARWRGARLERSLSAREHQVLERIAAGEQVARIADLLGISERSVHEYVARARRKLGAKSRSEAVAKALIMGLIEP